MWGTVLRWVAWVLTQAWRWGWGKVTRMANWAKNNYVTVYRWIVSGVAWDTIANWISNIVG
jgi:hypothetical protein